MIALAKICCHLQLFFVTSKFRMSWSITLQIVIKAAFMALKIFKVVKSLIGYLRSKEPATKCVKTLTR